MTEAVFVEASCDICGGSETIELMRLQTGAYHQCKRCGLVYVHPMPINYEEQNDHAYANTLERYVDKVRTKRKRYRRKLKRFSRYRQTGNFLEIGCNAGSFLDVAREVGWSVKGLDICVAAATYAREQLGLDVFTGTVEQAGYPDNFFDVIFTCSVLEHVRHPLSMLTECIRILRPGGIFYANTVNWDSYTRRLLGVHWKYLDVCAHIHLYTPANIRTLCHRAGFESAIIWSTGVRIKPNGITDFQTPWYWHLLKAPLSGLARIVNKGDHIEFMATKALR